MKVVALVDGEHHPAVTRWGLAAAAEAGWDVLAALVVAGGDKLDPHREPDLGAVPTLTAGTEPLPRTLVRLIDELKPDAVLDLSGEPALSDPARMELAAHVLAKGTPYVGPDFRFDPPIGEEALPVPTLAVIGTGKRVGKTAVSAHVARLAAEDGHEPAIVAMGRGGPPVPVVTRPADVTLDSLLALAARGEHAASDYLEDALTSGVPTVGARRSGGGLAGRPFATNLADAAAVALREGPGLLILEGSGAAVPTIPWDAAVLVAPAGISPEELTGWLGAYRILLSDLAVFIMGGGPSAGPEDLSALDSQVRRLRADVRVITAELIPVPLADVKGKDAFFATTASRELAGRLAGKIEETARCRVIGTSARLGDRAGLLEDLAEAPPFQVLLTELKASAVDVGARFARDRGAEVVVVDNRPRGDDLEAHLRELIELAGARAEARLTVG